MKKIEKSDYNKRMEPRIIRSRRKTISIEIKDGEVLVRAPLRVPNYEIQNFVAKNQKWIDTHLQKAKEQEEKYKNVVPFTKEEIEGYKQRALQVIPERVEHFASIMGLSYGKISIRAQRTLWGSCNSKGNLSFNCLLMLTPPEVIDSIVVHELCHLRHMNHSQKFYDDVLKYCPDYYKWNEWLKDYGKLILACMR